MRWPINRFGLLLIVWCTLSLAQQPDTVGAMSLHLDTSAADAVLALFDRRDVTKGDVDALLVIPAVQRTIAQTRRFDSTATSEMFVDSLLAVLNSEETAADPFRLSFIRERIVDIRRGLEQLRDDRAFIESEIMRRVAGYKPSELTFDTTIYLVLGGSSDGWAPGDGNFYLALQYFREDVVGLTAMATHELFHVVQAKYFRTLDPNAGQQSRLLAATLAEGTATLVGDPDSFDGDGRYLAILKEKHGRNLRRIRENFLLFEVLYFRLANDPAVNFGDVYNLGFSGGWDSPLYFVGFHIAEAIERHLGRQAMLRALQEEPGEAVFALYIKVYRENSDPGLVRFSPTIEALLIKEAGPSRDN